MSDIKIKAYILSGITAVICVAAAVSLLVYQNSADRRAEELLEEMRLQAENQTQTPSESSTENLPGNDVPASSDPAGDSASDSFEEQTSEPLPPLADNPYRDSFLANEDMAAWLKIEGTNIDYPVMWTPRDENYYLLRNFQGQSDQNGCLILDTDSGLNPLTTNLIIHGHNMRSGAMFGHLMDYADQDYCEEHGVITLYTEECERRYQVIAVFRSQVYKKTDQVFKFYKFFQADTSEEFDDFYQNIKALSLYDTGVTAEFGDRFITLSTCAYHVEMGRFVVVAKEIEEGDRYVPFRESADSKQDNTN